MPFLAHSVFGMTGLVIGVASCYAWGRGGGGGGLRNHTHNTYISTTDRPCVGDRQRDDASWFNYVNNIALFLINSSHSLQSPWDISVGGESLIFGAAIGYWIMVGQESAPSPISL